ncbi:hypothetical protein [uncultured Clostridium sp.]|jgi:hypothetical protein|uniref:hypothetical protein n=1 Tax=uncultured Clostridium sp. TaxID=59620 RepID=UPI002672A17F|nr:hypothetical protein [uncultured Clostridium sp.]
MSKANFERYMLRNISNIKNIYCRVWKGQGEIPGETASWLDVYIDGAEYETIFCSDYFEENSKDVLKLQKQWVKKLKNWINPNWELNLIIDEQYI